MFTAAGVSPGLLPTTGSLSSQRPCLPLCPLPFRKPREEDIDLPQESVARHNLPGDERALALGQARVRCAGDEGGRVLGQAARAGSKGIADGLWEEENTHQSQSQGKLQHRRAPAWRAGERGTAQPLPLHGHLSVRNYWGGGGLKTG